MDIKQKTFLILTLLILVNSFGVSAWCTASGGSIVYDGNYTVHTFKSNDTFVISGSCSNPVVELLVVAGGGGGGQFAGGGGGAGGVYYNASVNVTNTTTVIVGSGGLGATVSGNGTSGYNSSFGSLIAVGGGYGARQAGGYGGSGGGGGGGEAPFPSWNGGSYVSGQGWNGGNSSSGAVAGGGGGGANTSGFNGTAAQVGGNGGYGTNFSINGSVVCYAGGGGGSGAASYGTASVGCGGGDGGRDSPKHYAHNGTANTGGGGGGGYVETAGNGGSGIVIVRYLSANNSLSFIPPTPNNGSHNNTEVNISMTCSSTPANYTFYFDSNNPPTTKVIDNLENSSWVTNVTTSGYYYYRGSCGGGNSSVYTWVYDIDNPVATINTDCNEFNSANVTIKNPFDRNVSFCFNLTDNIGLYAYELEVFNSSGSKIYNFSNTSVGNITNYSLMNYTDSIVKAGSYTVNFTVADTHTAKLIPNYQVTKKKSFIQFKTQTGNNIKIETSELSDIEATKLTDRYTFSVVFSDGLTKNRTFHIKSECALSYLPYSRYKAHFVSYCNKDGNWVDFEGFAGVPSVIKVDDYHYTVTFTDLPPVVTFNSIGGLNIVSYSYGFGVGNATLSAGNTYPNGTNHTIVANFSTGGAFTLVNVSLVYNGTSYVSDCDYYADYIYCENTVLANGNGTVYFLFNYSVNGSGLFFNVTGNETVLLWELGVCNGATYNGTVINTTFFFEDLPQYNVNASMEVEIFYWSGTTNNNKTSNFNFTAYVYNYSICLNNNVSVQSDAYFKFHNDLGFTNRYYWYNKTLNMSSVSNYSLYLFNYTTGISNLKITIRNQQTYKYYPSVLAVLERRYLGEGVYRIVQMDLSDDYGLVFFNVIEENTDYKLLFYDTSNNLLKTASDLKFVCDSGICDLTALVSPYGSSEVEANISWYYTYNATTGIINVSWEDMNAEISSVRVWIAKQTMRGETTICNATTVGTSGSYACNVSAYTGEVLLRISKSASPESDFRAIWIKLNSTLDTLADILATSTGDNKDSVFWSFIMMVFISLLGLFSIVATILMGVVGLIVIYALGLFNPISVTIIVVAIVLGIAIAVKVKR